MSFSESKGQTLPRTWSSSSFGSYRSKKRRGSSVGDAGSESEGESLGTYTSKQRGGSSVGDAEDFVVFNECECPKQESPNFHSMVLYQYFFFNPNEPLRPFFLNEKEVVFIVYNVEYKFEFDSVDIFYDESNESQIKNVSCKYTSEQYQTSIYIVFKETTPNYLTNLNNLNTNTTDVLRIKQVSSKHMFLNQKFMKMINAKIPVQNHLQLSFFKTAAMFVVETTKKYDMNSYLNYTRQQKYAKYTQSQPRDNDKMKTIVKKLLFDLDSIRLQLLALLDQNLFVNVECKTIFVNCEPNIGSNFYSVFIGDLDSLAPPNEFEFMFPPMELVDFENHTTLQIQKEHFEQYLSWQIGVLLLETAILLDSVDTRAFISMNTATQIWESFREPTFDRVGWFQKYSASAKIQEDIGEYIQEILCLEQMPQYLFEKNSRTNIRDSLFDLLPSTYVQQKVEGFLNLKPTKISFRTWATQRVEDVEFYNTLKLPFEFLWFSTRPSQSFYYSDILEEDNFSSLRLSFKKNEKKLKKRLFPASSDDNELLELLD